MFVFGVCLINRIIGLSVNVINVVRLKSFLKWSFLYLTLVLCFFCLFQISLRAFGLYYFSFSNQAESELARYGVSSNNVHLEWRNFNPVLSLENVEHNFFKLEKENHVENFMASQNMFCLQLWVLIVLEL